MRATPRILAAMLFSSLAACQSPTSNPAPPGAAPAAQNAPHPVAPAAPLHAAPASARAVTPVQAAASSPAQTAAKNTAPGPAIGLHGDLARGAHVFASSCKKCHGASGKGGVPNKGSDDGTIPPLAPIDPQIASNDLLTFRTNVDRYIEHGSRPDGPDPDHDMPAFGDHHKLAPQQIADVIAYVVHLNPPKTKHPR